MSVGEETQRYRPQDVKVNGVYLHFKGDEYLVVGLARNASEGFDGNIMVLYHRLHDPLSLWVRDLQEFLGYKVNAARGGVVPRFRFLRML